LFVYIFVFTWVSLSNMASFDNIVAGLNQLSPGDRRWTLDFLARDLGDDLAEGGEEDGDADGDGDVPPPASVASASNRRNVAPTPYRPPMRKLRLFSGKAPPSQGEVDFETWRLQVKQMMDDDGVADIDKKATILQSLMRPALDTVSTMGRTASSKDCLDILETIYGRVEDGHDLVVTFHTTYQDDKELSSAYLNRLYLVLVEAADRGGLPISSIPTYLLRQFIRGCQDDSFVHRLNLERKLERPPNFGDFLLMVRREESRRTEKRLRLKKMSTTASSSPPRVSSDNSARSKTATDARTKELEAQVNQLTSQMQDMQRQFMSPSLGKPLSRTDVPPAGTTAPSTYSRTSDRRQRRTYFCYNCGMDGHRRSACKESANQELVFKKLNGLN
jgi:hypothetical protein